MDPVVQRQGEVAIVTVPGPQLDASNADDFKAAMSRLLDGCSHLVFDFQKVSFVDSSGCGAIISCLKRANAAGGDLKLCGVPPAVRSVFDLIRLHKICDIFATCEQAAAAF